MAAIRKVLLVLCLSAALLPCGTFPAPAYAAETAAPTASYDRTDPDTWAVNLPCAEAQYLFSHRMFASETYLFFVIEQEDVNGFAVYVTENYGNSFWQLPLTLPEGDYTRALPVFAGGGAGSGEGEFIVELRSVEGSKYVSLNNYHYTDSSNWLDFRCTGEVDPLYLADLREAYPDRFHDQPEIPLCGQEYTPLFTAEDLEKDGWVCGKSEILSHVFGGAEMRIYHRDGSKRTVFVDSATGETLLATDRTRASFLDINGDGQREVILNAFRTGADGYEQEDARLYVRSKDGVTAYGISKTLRARIPHGKEHQFTVGDDFAVIRYTELEEDSRIAVTHYVRCTEEGLWICETNRQLRA